MTVSPYGVRVAATRVTTPLSGSWPGRGAALLSCLLAAVAVALPVTGGHDYLAELFSTPEVVVAVSFSLTGALLAGHRSCRRTGWLLLGVGLVAGLFAASASYTAFVLKGDLDASLPRGEALGTLTAWTSTWAWLPPWLTVSTVLPQVLPHGQALSSRWRAPLVLTVLVVTAGTTLTALAPGPTTVFSGVDNPAGVTALGPASEALEAVAPVVFLALLALALASLVVRLRRAGPTERRQLGWVAYAVVLTVVVVLVLPGAWANLAVLLVPAGIATAALRYRLYDLDLVVNRTLVLALLLGAAAVAYVALVAWVGALVGAGEGATSFAVAVLLALLLQPARVVAQRWVDRLFFGRRGDPEELRRALDVLLRDSRTPREALARSAELLADGLRLSGLEVAVELPGGGRHVERAGLADRSAVLLPLTLHGERLGEVRAGARGGRGRLTGTDQQVLESLTAPVAAAAYALRLSGTLEDSRRELLAAREDERRRLRRDLHDGLGPQLAGVVMGLDVLRSSIAAGAPQRADDIAATVTGQVRSAVDDVRRLVAGLRPPVLDDLGLVAALQALVPPGARPALAVEGDVDAVAGAGLGAAVEVAVYRIAAEAVANAARHAGASRVVVELSLEDEHVVLTVRDDGRGLPAAVTTGVGLVSMRERAEELGGWCRVTSTGAGATVTARLPKDAS